MSFSTFHLKAILISIAALCIFVVPFVAVEIAPVYAENFEIVPEAEDPNKLVEGVNTVKKCDKSVRDCYNEQADKYAKDGNTGACFGTGIFSRDCILQYIAYVIRFLSQVGLIIGALMIIRAGYKYATAIYGGSDPGTKDIKNAIIGVLIVIFSYAIIRILQSAFF